MKIATAAYPIDWLDSWAAYEDKISRWVDVAAGQGADLLVFPEYGAMELASLGGTEAAGDLERSIHVVSEHIPAVDQLHKNLAQKHGLHILAASAPVAQDSGRPVNRSRFFGPTGDVVVQDKQIMTRFEREQWDIAPGDPLQVIETTLGRVGILICYDCEFPLLGRALAECDIILVPSCTDALSGYWRVRIGAMARALEQQCVTVLASTVGDAPWSPAVDENVGAGGVFCPPDKGFPPSGVLAEGPLNRAQWTYAEVDPALVAAVRQDGAVLNRRHWDEQQDRLAMVRKARLG
ncbi:carbon-nitrogen hydrolase family protein [Cognatishimia maritima]|uniref:Predicted amidohydrolase n=1 Tax=Cognatishimia maritima TaxID=870908 RepID=A0A1M5S8D7_9RHOB|nr:carbon-nitrogen hydrolase family protein [Cognatishimia maritima]SHH34766.1 Predicted amidohydrolase [Cognatishimia maritima]